MIDTTATSMTLSIQSRQLDSRTSALDLEGEMDVYTAPRLQQALQEQTDLGADRVVVNLAKVEYIDSTGLSALISGHAAMLQIGGALLVVAPRPRIARLLTITGLASRLSVYSNESDALAA
jgi:anti-sigma B factor antagonist